MSKWLPPTYNLWEETPLVPGDFMANNGPSNASQLIENTHLQFLRSNTDSIKVESHRCKVKFAQCAVRE